MTRPIEALVHTEALAHNLTVLKREAGAASVWADLGADACGHGLARAFAGLRGADGLAVLELSEAETLRGLGWRGPLLLTEGAFGPRDLERCSRLMLWHAVHCERQIDWLAMHKTHQPHRVFLRFDDGRQAIGFGPAAYRSAWTRLNALPQVDEITLMENPGPTEAAALTHDGGAGDERAAAAFDLATRDLPGERCLSRRAANPGADRAADWVLAGDALYGCTDGAPPGAGLMETLRATMTLRSHLVATRALRPGDALQGGFVAEHPMPVGVVACGAADGYPRRAHGAPVLIDGVRTRVVAAASRDHLLVDLTPVLAAGRDAGPGSEVTLWGEGPRGARLPIDDVARACGATCGDLMRAMTKRVPAPAPA